jgi:hypothetical protein
MRATGAVTTRRAVGLVIALVAGLTSAVPPVPATETPVLLPPQPPPSEEQRELVEAPGGEYGREEPRSLPLPDADSPQEFLGSLDSGTALSAIETAHRYDTGPFAGTEHVAEVTSGPSNFLDSSGNWRRIDPTLVPVTGGYRNGAGPFTVFFPALPTEATPITMTLEEGTLAVIPAAIDAASLLVGVHDNEITYSGMLTDTDVVYTVGYEGYKEEIVLNTTSAPGTVSFIVVATGLALRAEPGGAISVLSEQEVVGLFPPPWVQDSATDPVTGEGNSGPVTQTLTDLGGGRYRIQLAVDSAWLDDPARVFPVRIDPTNVTKFPSRDAYVAETSPTTNYGTSTELRIGSYNADGSATHYS